MENFLSEKEQLAAEILFILEYKIPKENFELYITLTNENQFYRYNGASWNSKEWVVRNSTVYDINDYIKSIEELNSIKDYLISMIKIFSDPKLKEEYKEVKKYDKKDNTENSVTLNIAKSLKMMEQENRWRA